MNNKEMLKAVTELAKTRKDGGEWGEMEVIKSQNHNFENHMQLLLNCGIFFRWGLKCILTLVITVKNGRKLG